jgi:hypothetical protein
MRTHLHLASRSRWDFFFFFFLFSFFFSFFSLNISSATNLAWLTFLSFFFCRRFFLGDFSFLFQAGHGVRAGLQGGMGDLGIVLFFFLYGRFPFWWDKLHTSLNPKNLFHQYV